MLSLKEEKNIEANCNMILQELAEKKNPMFDGEVDVFWSRAYQEGNDINLGSHQLEW